MKDLEQVVAESFSKVVASGAIEAAIEKSLTATITSAIEEQLRSHSDFGKQIKAQVSKSMNFDLERMDIPSHADLIMNIIRRQADASMQGSFTAKLEKNMAELLAPAPESIPLEKLIEDFITHFTDDDGSNAGEHFTLIIEPDRSGYWSVALDKRSRREKYQCEYRFHMNDDGSIYHIVIDGKDPKQSLFIGRLTGFERSLFQLYTAGTKIIIEPDTTADDFTTRFPEND